MAGNEMALRNLVERRILVATPLELSAATAVESTRPVGVDRVWKGTLRQHSSPGIVSGNRISFYPAGPAQGGAATTGTGPPGKTG